MLEHVKTTFDVPIVTDVHDASQVRHCTGTASSARLCCPNPVLPAESHRRLFHPTPRWGPL